MCLFSYPERLLAWRYMRSRRREGFISVITLFSILGIMLGVATLILVTSLMNGIREEMIKNFSGLDGQVTIYGMGSTLPLEAKKLAVFISRVNGVTSAEPRAEGQVMASNGGRALGAQVFGYAPDYLKTKKRIMENIKEGNIENFGSEPGIVIGQRLMENLGLHVGDMLTLISPQGRQTVVGMVPRIKAYPILATFALGQHALDGGVILMPLEEIGRAHV